MDEIIFEEKIWQEWDKFQKRIFPSVEMQKKWMHTPAKWSDLPEREKRSLYELNAFVQRILDSNEERIPEIFDEHPTELKLLLMFRLLRAGDILKSILYQYGAIRAPVGSDPVKALQDLFRTLLLQS
jgi:hypothetical protein